MLIDEQYIEDSQVYNMKNYSLKNGDKIIFVGFHSVYTIGNEFVADKSSQCIICHDNFKYLSNEFVLLDKINKYNYWHYYYSNSYVCKLLRDYRKINNSSMHICKEEQIKGIKNRLENIIEYGLMMFINLYETEIRYLYFNDDYEYYQKECEELNISEYYYYDKKNNKLIPFNSLKEYKKCIRKRKGRLICL